MSHVILRPISREDTANIVRWRNADFVRRNLFDQHEITEEQHNKYFENYIDTGLVKQYIISVLSGSAEQDIGTLFFKNIDIENRCAEFGIFVGEQDYLGCGYGTSAVANGLQIAFQTLQLRTVYALVLVDNISSKKMFLKNGFKEVEILKDQYRIDEAYVNVIRLAITNSMA